MRQKIGALLLLVFVVFALVACNGDEVTDIPNDEDTSQNEDVNGDTDLREFTLEELAQYDGQEGRDAYVAVDGYVYDVSDSDRWMDGIHQGRIEAGQDLTDEIDESPHGRAVLDRIPKIGILDDDNPVED